ncbi:MAG: OmpA family protein [Cyclobacteriaceae bacterium]
MVFSANGQKKKKKNRVLKLSEVVQTKPDTIPVDYHFSNINKVKYYYNKKQLAEIRKYQQKKQWVKLFPALKAYVLRFGIENFYKDTYLLWQLAKLTEHFGSETDATFLYKLVLKHHREGIDISKIELHYDSLIQDKTDYYVPLEYYYELVEFRKEVDTLQPPRGVLLNMGKSINSASADYGPTLHMDQNIMLLTSKRNERVVVDKRTQNEDLFFSYNYDGYWGEAMDMEGINTQYNEGSACLSRDGKTLYFARCHAPGSMGSCDLFVAELKPDSTWGNIKNLGVNVNSISWDSHPTLSHSEDTLFFASDRIGGFGLSDIYYTSKSGDGQWAPAKNLGPVINTRKNELSPFIHPKFNLLYYSSSGQLLNFGSFDIYKSYLVQSGMSEPKNIGPLVNGTGDEYYFTIDSESKDLYYARSSEKDLDNLDLFSFPLPMGAQPEATTSFSGSLMDSLSGAPFSGIVSIIDLDNGIEVAPKFLRPDGSFQFDLINNNNYLLIIQGDGFFRIEELFYLSGDTEWKKTTTPIASKLKFESVEFENGKAELLPEMYGDLDKIVDFMLDNPDFQLEISGHTDSDGSPELNLILSQKRAAAIREYLTYFGNIEESRIVATGYGDTQPIVEELTDDDKKLNRRVEFQISRPAKDD